MSHHLSLAKYCGELIGIYDDYNDLDRFFVGDLCACDTAYYLLHAYDPIGRDDGYFCAKIKDVIKVDVSSQYINDFAVKVMRRKNKLSLDHYRGGLLERVERYCMEKGKIAYIEIYNSDCVDLMGRLTSVDKGIITMELQTEEGISNGVAEINTKWITRFSWDEGAAN